MSTSPVVGALVSSTSVSTSGANVRLAAWMTEMFRRAVFSLSCSNTTSAPMICQAPKRQAKA